MSKTFFTVGLALVLVDAGPAWAEEEAKPVRRAYEVEANVSKAYAEQRDKAVKPARLMPSFEVKATLRVVAELAAYDDGVALLAVPVSDKRAAVLLRMGARTVELRTEARSHTVFKGRYYRAYGAFGVDPMSIEKLVGQKVSAEVVRTSDGRLRITRIHSAS